MAPFRVPRAQLLTGIPLVCLGVLLSAWAVADPYKPHDPPQLWPDGGHGSAGWAADPAPLRSAKQWVLTFRYQAGRVQLVGSRPLQLAQAVPTARRMGRYAIELLSGPALVDRVRFDFPLLAADELAGQPRRPYNDPPRFEIKAVVTHAVMVPDSSRISRARLVDRATGTILMLPWPPVPETPDGGTDARPDGAVDAAADSSARDGGALDGAMDALPIPDGWPVPDGWLPPIPRDAAPVPYPRDAGPFDASR